MKNILMMIVFSFAVVAQGYSQEGPGKPIPSLSQPQTIPPTAGVPQPVQLQQAVGTAAPQVEAQQFVVYTVKGAKENHFIPSGWMGDDGDVKMNDQVTKDCHSKDGCVQFVYNAQKSKGAGWAGVYWQNPANNWGEQKGGYKLAGMKKLTFWARGEKGTEQIEKFIVGGITGTYPDSAKVEMGPVKLTNTWQQYTIDLSDKDLSSISGGFGWATSAVLNPEGCTFYLDTIQFEKTPVAKQEKQQDNIAK